MIDRIKRRGFLKATMGGAVAVALGEMTGRREAKAATACEILDGSTACRSCNSICRQTCLNPKYADCPRCQTCRCASADNYCNSGCTSFCRQACFFSGGGCASCDVCKEPAA